MENKNIKLVALLLLGFCFNNGYAQQATTASGGEATGIGGSASYSVGQVVYTTHVGSNVSVAQGVQQPYEISVTIGLDETGINLNLLAYPNPTTNDLILEIDNYDKTLSYQLYDIGGKLIESKQITTSTTTIVMNELAAATYFLKVSRNKKEIKTFKILKN